MNKESVYQPQDVEEKWYRYWLDNHLFSSQPDPARKPYTIVIPPPNVTGVLHMGHMLNNTLQDILIRRARLLGYNACWVPGTDHASIATEAKVVARLAEKGIQKDDLSRDEFLKYAWEWTREHGGIILKQLRRIGASCDWDRTAFTLDAPRSEMVLKVFCDLYRSGLIYRGVRIVNWDPKARTALSDEEVIYQEEHSKLYYLRYKIEEGDGELIVATTRPETIMGDTAVCVHPEDERYQSFIGKKVIVPSVGRAIPVIADEYVDREFGTGCLKITPAHDINDHQIGEKHKLPTIDIFNDDGTLNEFGGKYEGVDRFEVRKRIVEDLDALGLLAKTEDYTNRVGYSERTHVAIEPKLSMQWFLRMEELAKPALEAVESDTIRLVPAKFKNTYRHWLENIKDWCISRQLRWGHRIPAYYLPDGSIVVAESKEKALQECQKSKNQSSLSLEDLRQDEDCLDTWFSSWLWPMSLFGDFFEKDNKELDYYYPSSVLVTGPDILFFWVARMIIAGYRYMKKPPFRDVYLTGIVRDAQGRKMSKSLGNSPDPITLIEKYGADGVRVGLMMATSAGNDLLYDEALLEQGRNFCNKVWNSFRLVSGFKVNENKTPTPEALVACNWFEARLCEALAEYNDLFSKYRISEALTAIYKLVRDDFSSFYLEVVKPAYGEAIDAITYQKTLDYFATLLQLMHPFMPFITEELWQDELFKHHGQSIMTSHLPETIGANKNKEGILLAIAQAREIITEVRNIRNKHNLSPKETLRLFVDDLHPVEINEVLSSQSNVLLESSQDLSNYKGVKASFIVGTLSYAVALDSAIDKGAMLEKLLADLKHQEGFLVGVQKKLSNERFVANAPEAVVALERKKESDAKSRIETLKKQIAEIDPSSLS